jgi:alkylation response protein AidB-like acyl-CoA dehydrogenase
VRAAGSDLDRLSRSDALALVAAGAADRDRDTAGRFPDDAFGALERAGLTRITAGTPVAAYPDELALLREVARADAGVARILDGHLNAVERLRVQAPAALRDRELAAIAAGRLRAGVWGADPGPDEGTPARLDGNGDTISGTKLFCSGAGGLDRALVLVSDPERAEPPSAAWVDLTVSGTVEIDRGWFRGAGMRSSASHRVTFHRAPVPAVLGPPGALTQQPWFARDAVRTAATWAGAVDAAVQDALAHLAARPQSSELEALAAGRLLTWQHGIGLWLHDAARVLADAPTAADAARTAAQTRAAIADTARAILDEAERATGSRPAAAAAPLDRAARDLRLFLLQHRLEPIVARAGHEALEERR